MFILSKRPSAAELLRALRQLYGIAYAAVALPLTLIGVFWRGTLPDTSAGFVLPVLLLMIVVFAVMMWFLAERTYASEAKVSNCLAAAIRLATVPAIPAAFAAMLWGDVWLAIGGMLISAGLFYLGWMRLVAYRYVPPPDPASDPAPDPASHST